MAIQFKQTVKDYFNAGDIPTEDNYKDLIDSNTFLSKTGLIQSNAGDILLNGHFSASAGSEDYNYLGGPISASGGPSMFEKLIVTSSISSSTNQSPSFLGQVVIGSLNTTVSTGQDYIGISHAGQAGAHGVSRSIKHCPIQYQNSNDHLHFKTVKPAGKIFFTVNNTDGATHNDHIIIESASIEIFEHISSSKNISSSLDIIARTGSFDFLTNPLENIAFNSITSLNNITAEGYISTTTSLTASIVSASNYVTTGNITASLNISASGNITASAMSLTGNLTGSTAEFSGLVEATGGFLGNLSGTATNATNVIAAANTENENQYIAFLDNNNTTAQQVLYDTGLKYNPSTNSATILGDLNVGDLTTGVQARLTAPSPTSQGSSLFIVPGGLPSSDPGVPGAVWKRLDPVAKLTYLMISV